MIYIERHEVRMKKKSKPDAVLYTLSALAIVTGLVFAVILLNSGAKDNDSLLLSDSTVSAESRPTFSYAMQSVQQSAAAQSETNVSSAAASTASSPQATVWQDSTAGQGSSIGNSNGNTLNDGYFAEWRDGVVIFANPGDDFKLYRYNAGGSVKKISEDVVYYLNVVGDWIYYSNVQEEGKLYRIRPDGTERTLLCKDDCCWTNALDGWLYFNGDSANLCKVSLDGKTYQKLTEDKVTWVNVAEDGFAYVVLSRENERICRFKLDGSGKTILADDVVRFLNYNDGWLYYINKSDSNTIYKISADGSGRQKLTQSGTEFINISDGWIYYNNTAQNGALYKMKTDGSGNAKVTGDKAYYINIASGWIFYINESDRGLLYQIKPDGTGRKKVG